jgi:hypothetical protein
MCKDAAVWAFKKLPPDIRAALRDLGGRTFRHRGELLRSFDKIVAAHRKTHGLDEWTAPEILNWLIAHGKVRQVPRIIMSARP